MSVEHCPDAETLKAFSTGRLGMPDWDGVAEHVTGCSTCQDLLDTLHHETGTLMRLARLVKDRPSLLDDHGCRKAVERYQQIVLADEPPLGDLPDLPATEVGTESQSTPPPGSSDSSEIAAPFQLGPYRIEEPIGRGGMGCVYRAVHTKLDKPVALKILKLNSADSRDLIDRFQREMKAVGRLEHPNLVRATDAGEDQGVHYLTMELIEGSDLAALVREKGPFPVESTCNVIRQAAIGLHAIHEQGLVHRDIKPSNLMLTQDGHVKILDLGLALLTKVHEPDLTGLGQMMGTLAYMAPEQASDSHLVDGRSDIYSLGCTLYYLLVGREPYPLQKPASPLKHAMAHAQAPIPDVADERPDVPAPLAEWLSQCLAKEPDRRPKTALDVAKALEAFTGDENQEEEGANESEIKSQARKPKRRGAVGFLLLLGCLGGLIALAVTLISIRTEHGTLYLELSGVNARDVQVKINEEYVAVEPGRNGRRLKLSVPPGRHDLLVEYEGLSIKTEQNHFEIAAGTERTIRAWYEPNQVSEQGSKEKAAAAEKMPPSKILISPEWVWTEPVNLGPHINGRWWDQAPELTGDGKTLIYNPGKDGIERKAELWTTSRDDRSGAWSLPKKLGPAINSEYGETDPTISADGKTLIIMSPDRPGGQGGPDLWMSTRESREEEWEPLGNMGPLINTEAEESNPDLSGDGRTLVFYSDRDGKREFWTSTRQSVEAPWSKPVKFKFPFEASEICVRDELSLTSDGLAVIFWSYPCPNAVGIGQGQADIWMCLREDRNSSWSNPLNLGPVINSESHDREATISADCKTLIFVSDRPGGQGKWDLWMSRRVPRNEIRKEATSQTPPKEMQKESLDPKPARAAKPPPENPVSFQGLNREDIPARELALLGGGNPANAPVELVGMIGDSRFKQPSLVKVAYSPDGRQIATVNVNGTAVVWDAETGRPIRTIPTPGPFGWCQLYDIEFTADGEGLATLINAPRLWRLADGKHLHVYSGRSRSMDLSRDGRLIAHSPRLGQIVVADLETAKQIFACRPNRAHANAMAFGPDGDLVAAGYSDGTVSVWSREAEEELYRLDADAGKIVDITFSPDGQLIASCAIKDSTVHVWDVPTGKLVRAVEGTHDYMRAVDFSPDGKILAASGGSRIRLWQTTNWMQSTYAAESYLGDFAFSPDGSRIAYTGRAGLTVIETKTKNLLKSPVSAKILVDVRLKDDGELSLYGWLEQLPRNLFIRKHGKSNKPMFRHPAIDIYLDSPASVSNLFHSKKHVVALDNDNHLKVWEIDTGKEVYAFPWDHAKHEIAAIEPRGEKLAIGFKYGRLTMIDLVVGRETGTVSAHDETVRQLVFVDSDTLISTDGASVKIWDADLTRPPNVITEQSAGALAVSRKGDFFSFVQGSTRDHRIHGPYELCVYEGETRKRVGVIKPEFLPKASSVSSDGRLVAASARDGRLAVWDVESQTRLHSWDLPFSCRPKFTPDGRFLITVNGNGTAYVFHVSQ